MTDDPMTLEERCSRSIHCILADGHEGYCRDSGKPMKKISLRTRNDDVIDKLKRRAAELEGVLVHVTTQLHIRLGHKGAWIAECDQGICPSVAALTQETPDD